MPILFFKLVSSNQEMFFVADILEYARNVFGLLFIFFIPFIISKIGIVKMTSGIILLYCALLILSSFYDVNSFVQILYMIIFGVVASFLFIIVNSISNAMVNSDKRGQLNAVLNAMFLFTAVFLPKFIKNTYLISVLCGIASIISLYAIKNIKNNDIKFNKLSLIKIIRENYILFMSKIAYEFAFVVLSAFTYSFSNANNWDYQIGGTTLLALYITNILSSYFIGRFFDNYNNKNLLLYVSSLSTIALISLLPFITNYILFFMIYCLIGITLASIYISCASILNSKYDKEYLLSVNSSLLIVKYLVYIFSILFAIMFKNGTIIFLITSYLIILSLKFLYRK
jgi:MFS family permease